ncbi:MAG TPA: hypothetical protein VHG92_14755 [Afifellaceae bacterium]|nr:hypothetical protein [Afifellaceae bacterium]
MPGVDINLIEEVAVIARWLSAGLIGLALTVSAASGTAFASGPDMPAAMIAANHGAAAANPARYRAHRHGVRKHRRAGEPFILRRPEYGTLLYLYDQRASYPYRCVPRTAAQFHYCRERFITVDPVTGAWVSYAPYGHLCYCR